jgi:nicotinamidase-related amidase
MKSIYLVLDMQNDFVHREGASAKAPMGEQVRERGVVAKTAQAISKARGANVSVGFVRVGFSPDYKECPTGSQVFSGAPKAGILKLGTFGTEIHPDLGPRQSEVLITKHRVSPFYNTSLEILLRTMGVNRIYCSGVSTQAVVQATVRDGHDRDFEMVVIEDCCAAHSAAEHANSVASIGRFCSVATLESVQFT